MKKLILTLDYELYGNGSGNVFRHIIEPTEKILAIAERYNAKITIFFEVIEYWKLKEEWKKGNRMGYERNPVAAIEEQLKWAYSKGHDIQLHLHPQWVDAIWTENCWKVNMNKWRLGDYEGVGDNSLVNLLKRGKETIEVLIGNGYQCEVLRAGGYNVQPSQALVKAMREAGLKIDSSIYPGGKETGSLSKYDYTTINADLGFWYCDKTLETVCAGKSDVIEMPIVALPILRLQKYLSMDRIKSLLQNRQSAKSAFDAKTSQGKKCSMGKVQYFFQKEWQTWDYCLFSKGMHNKFLKHIEKQTERDLFVLVGHPKSFVSSSGLEFLCKKAQNKYLFDSISNYLNSCNLK